MSFIYTVRKSLQAGLFTATIYGWLVPTVWVSNQLNKWIPTHQLSSTDWVIESGIPNTSWDLITTDGSEKVDDEESLNDKINETPAPTDTSNTENIEQSDPLPPSPLEDTNNVNNSELVAPVPSKTDSVNTMRTVKRVHSHSAKRFTTKKKTARRGKCNVENPNIKRAGKNAYSVPKSTVKHYSTHWKEASRLAHLSWAVARDGSRLGIRIRGISCRSPLKFTGLRRGDIVISVNDHSVQSEKDLLKVYGRLLFWKKMDVKVKRGKEMVTLRYDII